MTTPTGQISFQDVANEFGQARPIYMSNFRGLGGAPSNTSVSMADLRGRSSITFSTPDGTFRPQNGATYTYEQSNQFTCSLGASGYTISYTQSGATASPATGSTTGGQSFTSPARQKGDLTSTWVISVNGISFTLRMTTVGTING